MAGLVTFDSTFDNTFGYDKGNVDDNEVINLISKITPIVTLRSKIRPIITLKSKTKK